MYRSGFNPLIHLRFRRRNVGRLAWALCCFTLSMNLMAFGAEGERYCDEAKQPGEFCLEPIEGQSGYQFSYEDQVLSVQPLSFQQVDQPNLRQYRLPKGSSSEPPSYEVVQLGERRQLVVVTSRETSYSLLFLTQPIGRRSVDSPAEVLLVLRGRLRTAERELQLVKRNKALYLIDESEEKVCGLASEHVRKLDLQRGRFKRVRRSPLPSVLR